MKKSNFRHLFSKDEEKQDPSLPTDNAKKLLFGFFLGFFLLYLNYKPYDASSDRVVHGLLEFVFFIYQFIINQTVGIVHEGGHGICYLLPCPQFLTALNGTVFQWLFPLGIAYYYKRKGSLILFYVGLFILSISMDYTSWYMSTAHEGLYVSAEKAFLGEAGYHDFNYMFSALGVLEYESWIAGFTKMASTLVMFGSMVGMFLEAFSNKKQP